MKIVIECSTIMHQQFHLKCIYLDFKNSFSYSFTKSFLKKWTCRICAHTCLIFSYSFRFLSVVNNVIRKKTEQYDSFAFTPQLNLVEDPN